MKYFPKLRGERIYLSPMSLQDAETYTNWMNDSRVTDNLGMSSILYTLEKEKEFLEQRQKDEYHFAIVTLDTDRLLGNTSLFALDRVNRTADFGIFLGEELMRNKGYGAEAARLLIQYGFATLNLNNIMLRVFAFNKNAIACYEKIGFKKVGARRNAYYANGEYHDVIFMDIVNGELR